jgi:peptide-methionine (S)-S-oxide reductase
LIPHEGTALAAFAAGCFWGVEDNFRQVPGVVATAVGYTGGHTEAPTYPVVCSHTTGHAETVLVEFEPKVVTYETLLNVFFKNHDPTTKNRQGPDIGDQYRSAVFTFSPRRKPPRRQRSHANRGFIPSRS